MEQSTYNKSLIEWANDHYWDSLEKDKDLILKHLRNFGKSIQADQVDAEDLCDCDCKWSAGPIENNLCDGI